ncbi:MAG: hypothetical protein ACLR8L_14815 [Oscillospiraceae bacterium]
MERTKSAENHSNLDFDRGYRTTIMTTVVGQSIGILQSMRMEQAASLNGNRYATFHQLNQEQAQKLHEDDRLYDVGDIIFVGSTPLGSSSLSLYLREYHDNASIYVSVNRNYKRVDVYQRPQTKLHYQKIVSNISD